MLVQSILIAAAIINSSFKPEVLAVEQKKKADALARIQTIEESLAQLG